MNCKLHHALLLAAIVTCTFFVGKGIAVAEELHVVATLPDYASITKMIGGDRVRVEAIVQPVQDPHHVRPKPSFVKIPPSIGIASDLNKPTTSKLSL